ncbi:MAG TPA: hypothetical protein PKD51_12025 [Saprospiraceae bacterium]|nr:hypothetical protein [Saprospiraceae bacterium]
MRTLTIFSFLFILMMTSCRKESLTLIDETETENPKPIDGAFFKGVVTSKTGVVSDAVVEIYQHEKLIDVVNTDANGAFNTLGIDLDTMSHITFAVKHTDFNIRAKRVSGNSKKQDLGKISLSKDQIYPTEQTYLNNPGSDELIVVSGYVNNTSGMPALADVLIIYDITEVAPFTYEVEGDGVSTDENGYYELLLPKNQEFFYYVQQSLCTPRILTTDQERIFGGAFPVEKIGPFQSNVTLPTLNNAQTNVIGIEEQEVGFTAFGLQCDGNIVKNGKLEGRLTKGSQTFNINMAAVSGFFFYGQTFCIKQENLNATWKLEFTITDFENVQKSVPYSFDITTATQELGFLSVCNETLTEKPFVYWSVGATPYYYEVNEGVIDNTGTLISSATTSTSSGNLKFTIPGYTSGNDKIKNFTFNGNLVGQFYSFAQKPSDDLTITYLPTSDPKIVKGKFTGDLNNTSTNVSFPVNGVFLVKLP